MPPLARVPANETPASARLRAQRPLVIAHRGFSAAAPENTLAAFRQAIDAGADLVELDYRHSRDGVPVVLHDPTLDRTTDARRRWGRRGIRVAECAWTDLQTLDAGTWTGPAHAGARLPSLAQALAVIRGGSVALVERKAGDAATCVSLLRDRKLINHVVVQSFDWAYLREVHRLAPEQVLGALGPPDPAEGRASTGTREALTAAHLDEIGQTGARIVAWNHRVSRAIVQEAHRRGLRVWIYTIDRPEVAQTLLDRGVDGIITNQPALMRKRLDSSNPRNGKRPGCA